MQGPRSGDVLVSKVTARVEYEVTDGTARLVSAHPNQASGMARAVELAKERKVDAWLTQDHIHFVKISSQRVESQGPSPINFGISLSGHVEAPQG